MANLPEQFLTIMKRLLKDEYEAFLDSYDQGREYGLRVNTAKISTEEFERIAPFHLTKIPWIPNGYFYEEEDYPARHPFYAAGLYYLQEPSAMTPASRLPVYPGERVLDSCAAPGGKATALGAKLNTWVRNSSQTDAQTDETQKQPLVQANVLADGLLVANDINAARGKALLRNIELFGISNTFVTNEPPYKLTERFPLYFDKIMVDAPCSGEGMFRKNPAAVDNWLEKGPEYFSKLQQEIIMAAADMLKPGGMMFYSTCTFSPLENEWTITRLLEERPEMEVIPMEDYEGFSTGFTGEELAVLSDLYPELKTVPECVGHTRRIWPHKMNGEGHFLALLHKKEDPDYVDPYGEADRKAEKKNKKAKKGKNAGETTIGKGAKGRNGNRSPKKGAQGGSGLTKEQRQDMDAFFSHVTPALDYERVDVRGDKVYYLPQMLCSEARKDQIMGIHFLRNGIYLGDLKKNRFEPSQPYSLTLSKDSYDLTLDFDGADERLQAYLRGETIEVADLVEKRKEAGQSVENGWYLVAVSGFGLGFGKLAGTTLKNKYPTGWRVYV